MDPVQTLKQQHDAAWDKLYKAGKRRGDNYESLDWVLDNIETDPRDIAVKSVPNAGSVTMLKNLQSSEDAKAKFLETQWKQVGDKAKLRMKGDVDQSQADRWTQATMKESADVINAIRKGADEA